MRTELLELFHLIRIQHLFDLLFRGFVNRLHLLTLLIVSQGRIVVKRLHLRYLRNQNGLDFLLLAGGEIEHLGQVRQHLVDIGRPVFVPVTMPSLAWGRRRILIGAWR